MDDPIRNRADAMGAMSSWVASPPIVRVLSREIVLTHGTFSLAGVRPAPACSGRSRWRGVDATRGLPGSASDCPALSAGPPPFHPTTAASRRSRLLPMVWRAAGATRRGGDSSKSEAEPGGERARICGTFARRRDRRRIGGRRKTRPCRWNDRSPAAPMWEADRASCREYRRGWIGMVERAPAEERPLRLVTMRGVS